MTARNPSVYAGLKGDPRLVKTGNTARREQLRGRGGESFAQRAIMPVGHGGASVFRILMRRTTIAAAVVQRARTELAVPGLPLHSLQDSLFSPTASASNPQAQPST
jgi:hypothetical protein